MSQAGRRGKGSDGCVAGYWQQCQSDQEKPAAYHSHLPPGTVIEQEVYTPTAGPDNQSAGEILHVIVSAPFVIGGVAQSLLHFGIGTPDPAKAAPRCRRALWLPTSVFGISFDPIAAIKPPGTISVKDIDVFVIILTPESATTDEIFFCHPYSSAGMKGAAEIIKIASRGSSESAVNGITTDYRGRCRRKRRRVCGSDGWR